MNVRELREWLDNFHDQDAIVEVVESEYVGYDRDASKVTFDPEKHVDYIDLKGNPFVKEGDLNKDKSFLLLGLIK